MPEERKDILERLVFNDEADFGKVGEAELHTMWGVLALLRDLSPGAPSREIAQDCRMFEERLEFMCDKYESERQRER